jgi:hypothetical protein
MKASAAVSAERRPLPLLRRSASARVFGFELLFLPVVDRLSLVAFFAMF